MKKTTFTYCEMVRDTLEEGGREILGRPDFQLSEDRVQRWLDEVAKAERRRRVLTLPTKIRYCFPKDKGPVLST